MKRQIHPATCRLKSLKMRTAHSGHIIIDTLDFVPSIRDSSFLHTPKQLPQKCFSPWFSHGHHNYQPWDKQVFLISDSGPLNRNRLLPGAPPGSPDIYRETLWTVLQNIAPARWFGASSDPTWSGFDLDDIRELSQQVGPIKSRWHNTKLEGKKIRYRSL